MPKAGIDQEILAALEARAADHGVDVVAVEVVGATKNPCVRVYIDHADEEAETITLDEVAAETGWIGELLDELDPLPAAYTLEVSSPGMARPLRRERDFSRFAGNDVTLTTTEGRRKYTGALKGFEEGAVILEADGEQVRIPLDQVKKCNIKPDFSAQKKK
ncbi:ribosome maturation factor RimP [Paratractidigestivibacter sp.]|uniref:ribosome maturation factor RimP n=1 Tax=Paratractidigestivibacter sp. TaxID=2847316 RepID=UPI002ABE9909|nr:ribosome maturation factor RimP [Paratractidigestivibacter sp.]